MVNDDETVPISSTTGDALGLDPDRLKRAQEILRGYFAVRSCLDNGELNEEMLRELLAAHGDAMPELEVEIRKLLRIAQAQQIARQKRFGDYELLEMIGTGGMGIVYRARQLSVNRLVAVKTIKAGRLAESRDIERFHAEVAANARLNHPGIVPIYDVGNLDGQSYFTMALVEGASLSERLRQDPLPPRAAAELARKIADAVRHAHSKNVIHRDLKPANILIDKDGEIRVTDFGLAKRLEADAGLTASGQVLGTPSFMPPEQAAGDQTKIDETSDVYSLGAVLYCMLAGVPPFRAATQTETIRQVIEEEPASLRGRNRDVPRDLETICFKCLRKDPQRRYRSMAELIEDLDRFLEGRTILARPAGRFERSWRWVRRNPITTWLIALLIISVSIGLAAFLREARHAVRQGEFARRQAYRANMQAAAFALRSHDAVAARHALEAAPPELRNWEWRHLFSRLDAASGAFLGHADDVLVTAFNPDGNLVASGSADGEVQIWNVSSGNLVGAGMHSDAVRFLLFGPGGQLVSSSDDSTVKLWDPVAGRVTSELLVESDYEPITAFEGVGPGGAPVVAFLEDGTCIAAAVVGRSVSIWNVAAGEQIAQLVGHQSRVVTITIDAVHDQIATASDGNSVRIWELDSGKELRKLPSPLGNTLLLAFGPGGQTITSSHRHPDNALIVWDAVDGRQIQLFSDFRNSVTSVAHHPDGRLLAAACMDSTIRLLNRTSGRVVASLSGHTGYATQVVFSPNGKRLASIAQDRTISLWDSATGELVAVMIGHTGVVTHVSFSSDGKYIASGSRDGSVRIWDLGVVEHAHVLRGHSDFVYDCAFSPDGGTIVSVGWDKAVRFWDSTTGRLKGELAHENTIAVDVAFHPDGSLIATTTEDDNKLRIWDVALRRLERVLLVPADATTDGVAFSPDGRLLACGATDGRVRVWDLANGRETALFARHAKGVTNLTFAAGGALLVSAGEDGMVQLWNVPDRRAVASLAGSDASVESIALSHDGRMLASASHDGDVRLWDLRARRQVALLGHSCVAYDVAFSHDDERLAVACLDHTIRLWDTRNHEEVALLFGHEDYVHAVAFSPDGTQLVSCSGDFTVRLWRTSPP